MSPSPRLLPAWAGAASALFFAASVWVPPVGFVLSLGSPAPIGLAAFRAGPRGGLIALAVSAVAASVLTGVAGGALFVAQFAAGGLVLGLALRARRGAAAVVGGYAAVATGAFWVTLAAMATATGSSPGAYLAETLGHTRDLLSQAFSTGNLDPESAAAVQAGLDQTYRFLLSVFPGLSAALALLTGWLNALVVRRATGDDAEPGWCAWRAPEPWIWVLLGSGLAGALASGTVGTLGWNLFAVAITVYFLQGLAVMHHVFVTRHFPKVLRTVAYALVFLQLPVMLLVAGLGAFDLWVDFRSRLAPRPSEGTGA